MERERSDSPGHSIVIPNGTPFKIAKEGPQSNSFVTGTCRSGFFIVEDGEHAGKKFRSANEAVNAIREPSSNAFLYLHFRIDGAWTSADDFRRSEYSQLDEAEEYALEQALGLVRRHPKGKTMDDATALMKAAEIVVKRPERVEQARRLLAISPDLSVLGL